MQHVNQYCNLFPMCVCITVEIKFESEYFMTFFKGPTEACGDIGEIGDIVFLLFCGVTV